MSTLAIDTECTGLNFHKGVRPFFVSTCDDKGNQKWWEFPVDPYTRKVKVPTSFIPEFLLYIRRYDSLVFHHANYDIHALETVGIDSSVLLPKVEDTMLEPPSSIGRRFFDGETRRNVLRPRGW